LLARVPLGPRPLLHQLNDADLAILALLGRDRQQREEDAAPAPDRTGAAGAELAEVSEMARKLTPEEQGLALLLSASRVSDEAVCAATTELRRVVSEAKVIADRGDIGLWEAAAANWQG
jgi:hypothetical protein